MIVPIVGLATLTIIAIMVGIGYVYRMATYVASMPNLDRIDEVYHRMD